MRRASMANPEPLGESARQREQEQLMERAKREPGIATALEVYARLAASPSVQPAPPSVRYSTGGNPPSQQ